MAPIAPYRRSALQLDRTFLLSEHLPHFASRQPYSLSLPLFTCGAFAAPSAAGCQIRHGGFRRGKGNARFGGRWLKVGRRGFSDLKGGGFGGRRGGGRGRWNSGAGDGSGEEETAGTSLFSWYLDTLQKYPLRTNSVTTAVLNLLGDLICQILIEQAPELDPKRLVVNTSLGIALVGPTFHFWFYYLNRLVVLHGPLGSVSRLVIDQFLFSPFFSGVFISSLVTLEGRVSQIVPILQQEWPSVVLASWQFWIPFQFLNFQFVRQQYQPLAANLATLAWNVILSFNTHKEVIMK